MFGLCVWFVRLVCVFGRWEVWSIMDLIIKNIEEVANYVNDIKTVSNGIF